jgi:hypothetical protein
MFADFSYDPKTKFHAVDVFPETGYVTALAARKDAPGVSVQQRPVADGSS